MSDFKDNLNEEIEKRLDDEEVPNSEQEISSKLKPKSFSFRTFLFGLLICSVLTAALIGWAKLKSAETTTALLEKLPSKTAIVDSIIVENKTQTTLSMTKNADETASPHAPNIAAPVPYGTLPEVNKETGAKPYKTYQATFAKKTDKPLLSFVIADLGLSSKKTSRIIQNFPAEISLTFSPYTKNLNTLTETARKDGHEVWLTLPLETKEYPLNDPGPLTLLVNASTEKNTARLHKLLATTQSYVGFITQPNHVFKSEDANVNTAIKEIFERGLAVIDTALSIHSFIDTLADKNDYPHTQNDLWLDDDLSPLSLNKNIREIISYGEQNRNIIVMLRPYPASLKAVQKFLNSKAADKFELAPVSAQLKNN